MKTYMVELSCHWYTEVEVEAEDEDKAVQYAMDIADDEIHNESIDWDVDFVEEMDEEGNFINDN